MRPICPDPPQEFMVDIHHMAQALTPTFKSATTETIRSLPLHQQVRGGTCAISPQSEGVMWM